jgi:WD40 repeat protein
MPEGKSWSRPMRNATLGLATLWLLLPVFRAEAQDPALPPGALLRLGSEDLRHPWAAEILFSPDGTTLISGGMDIRIWDARTRRLLRKIQPDPVKDPGIHYLRLSGDGKTLCALTSTAAIAGYDLASGKQLFRLQPEKVYFSALALSPDGKILATGSQKNELALWNTATQEKMRILEGHKRSCPGPADDLYHLIVAFSPDGKWLASVAGYDDAVRVFEVATGKLKHTFPRNGMFTSPVVFTPDSAYLVTYRHARPAEQQNVPVVTLWDLATGKSHKDYDEPAHYGFALSPDGKWMAGDSGQGKLHVWDAATGKRRISLPSGVGFGWGSLAFSPDGDTLVASNSTSLEMWDLKTGRSLLADDGHTGIIRGLDLSADGRTIATGGTDGTVFLWDAQTGKVKHRFANLGMHVGSVAFAPDGGTLASCSYFSTDAILWDVATGKELRRFPLGDNIYGARVAFSGSGKTLAVATYSNLTYHFFETATGKQQHRFSWYFGAGLSAGHVPFRFSPDGKHFAGVYARQGTDFSVALWDMRKKEPQVVSLETNHITDIAFSPDGEYLAWGDLKDVHIWDVRQNCKLLTLKGTVAACLAFTPDGHYLAAGKKLHPLDPKLPTLELPINPGQLAFAVDGSIAVTVPLDECTALVLDARKLAKKN